MLRPALLAGLVLGLLVPALPAEAGEMRPECRRFERGPDQPAGFLPRLARLCVRLVDAHDSPPGMSGEERDAAVRLGHYLAVIGELDLRRGAAGFAPASRNVKGTTETARYLIAYRIGLLHVADRLAPAPPVSAALR